MFVPLLLANLEDPYITPKPLTARYASKVIARRTGFMQKRAPSASSCSSPIRNTRSSIGAKLGTEGAPVSDGVPDLDGSTLPLQASTFAVFDSIFITPWHDPAQGSCRRRQRTSQGRKSGVWRKALAAKR